MSETMPLVSVIVIVRNEARFIAKTLESVLNQDYPSIEIHVQDGGSTDGTIEIVERYPVTLVSEPDKGQADAGNRGFRATKGEIVIFEGGDDLLYPDAVNTMVRALLQDQNLGFVYGDVDTIDETGRVYATLKGKPYDLDRLFWNNLVPSQSVAIRRAALEKTGLYREEVLLCADWDLWLRLGARYNSRYIPKRLACYRTHDGSSSLNNLTRHAKDVCATAETLTREPDIAGKLRFGPSRALAGSYFTAALTYGLSGELKLAWGFYRKAIRSQPSACLTLKGAWALTGILMGPKMHRRIRNLGGPKPMVRRMLRRVAGGATGKLLGRLFSA